MATALDLPRWRAEFPTLADKTYLNSCSLGPLSRRSMRYMGMFQRLWFEQGSLAWHEWLPAQERVRELYAQVIGAGADEIAVQPNVSAALAMVGSLVDFTRRRKVVVGGLDFPTMTHQWLVKERLGIEVVWVESEDGVTIPAEKLAAAVDDRTALVCTTHVYYTSGYIQDIGPIAAAARRHGALLCVDGYHAVGSVPFDVHELGCDFYTGGVLKWLMGGPGLAFLYVRRELHDLMPTVAAWLATEQPFDFDNRAWKPAQGARRFEYGTPAVAAAYAGMGGLEIALEVGLDTIRQRQMALTERLVELADYMGFTVASPRDPQRRNGLVVLRGLTRPDATTDLLNQQGFVLDHRPGCIRVSPHFFNIEEEVDRFMQELRRVQGQLR